MTVALDPVIEHPDDHYLPQEEWDRIVEAAELEWLARFSEPGGGAGDWEPVAVTPIIVQFPNSPYDKSSALTANPAQLYVVHTGETPLRVGYAKSLTEWADGDSYKPRVSWRAFIDPATVCLFIPRTEAAWHAAGANTISLGYEQSGYASYSREQWLSPDGRRQIDLLAEQMVKDGLRKEDRRWLTDAQVKAIMDRKDKTTRGLCTHEQVSRLSGRTSRTDPGKGYPKDVLLDAIAYHQGDGGSVTPPPTTPSQPSSKIDEDGKWGPGTTRALQRTFGTKVDGIVSNQTAYIRDSNPGLEARPNWEFNDTRRGSDLIRALMRRLARRGFYKGEIDGLAGPMFWKAFHRDLGLGDGDNIDDPDGAVLRMQQAYNKGAYRP